MLIGFKILWSKESPYFSHYGCKILGSRDFDFKSYKRKCSESSKWWLQPFMNLCYIFAYNFYKQHLLHVKCYRRNEKNRGFIWYQKLHFNRWIQKWWGHTPLIVTVFITITRETQSNDFSGRSMLWILYSTKLIKINFLG